MTPFERLKTLVEWNLSDNVKEEKINMDIYLNACGTSGCRAGWGATCPALMKEGYHIEKGAAILNIGIAIHGDFVNYWDEVFPQFFGLTEEESSLFFSPDCLGTKEELRKTWEDYCQGRGK